MRSWSELKADGLFYLSRRLNRSLVAPDWLTINLTLRCNLSCSMCTTCYDAPELSKQEILDLIDQAEGLGFSVFNPLGGEPFVRQDLEEILAYAAKRKLHTTLTTNGTLIHPHRAARIAEIPPEKLHINISLDGPEAIHDGIRGAGSFKKTIQGFLRLREADERAGNPVRKICANSILHRKNVHPFPEFVGQLKELGFSGVQILNLFRGGTEKTADELWFYPEHLSQLQDTVERLLQRSDRFILNRPEDLRLIPRYYQEGLKPLEAPCWAGWKELYINTDGRAIMCDGKLDFLNGAFGDIRKQTLKELLASPELAARRNIVKQCSTPCMQNCYLRRESDSGRVLLKTASAKLIEQLQVREQQQQKVPLILELCDIPSEGNHPKLQRLLKGKNYSEADYLRLLREGALDTSRGFMGAGILEQLWKAVQQSGLQFAWVELSWRGDSFLHPELDRIVERIGRWQKQEVFEVRIQGNPKLKLPGIAVVEQGYRGRAAVISWDGKLTADTEDRLLKRVLGDVLHEPLGEVWSRA
jgi:MoaA/NifB/PqqE/SkfB family radical SAM enzyme